MNRKHWQLHEDRVVAAAIVAISVAYWISSQALGSMRSDDSVGPAGFPLLISACSFLLGVALWFRPADPEQQESLSGPVWIYWLMFLAYAFAAHYLGFALSTAIFLAGTFLILKVKAWRAVLVAVIVTAVLWLVFAKLMEVRLSLGFWS